MISPFTIKIEPLKDAPHINFLSGSPLDRLGHLRGRDDWIEQMLGHGETRFVPTRGARNLLVMSDRPRAALLRAADVDAMGGGRESPIFLGAFRERHFFSVLMEETASPPQTMEFRDLRGIASLMEPWEISLLAYARAMANWHQNHGYCACCGSPTASVSAGHSRVCSSETCGRHHFPKVDPAIIVLVSDGDRCLLGRQADWPEGRYSTIAGFVEPGESLEDAVRREVREETGIRISAAHYHSSQPWPFPAALMLGFFADAASTEIELLDGELAEARWISRDDIRAGEVMLSPRVSIAYALIRHWFDSEPGASLDELTASGPPVWR